MEIVWARHNWLRGTVAVFQQRSREYTFQGWMISSKRGEEKRVWSSASRAHRRTTADVGWAEEGHSCWPPAYPFSGESEIFFIRSFAHSLALFRLFLSSAWAPGKQREYQIKLRSSDGVFRLPSPLSLWHLSSLTAPLLYPAIDLSTFIHFHYSQLPCTPAHSSKKRYMKIQIFKRFHPDAHYPVLHLFTIVSL